MSLILLPRTNSPPDVPSPLVICDRLLTLAQDADRAGFTVTAEHLLDLANNLFEEPRVGA